MSLFEWFLVGLSVAGGFVGSVSGFGIGSLITPLLASVVETKLAVAIVSVPHFIGTAIRFWTLRDAVDRRILWRFGIASAVGGLIGALLYAASGNPFLTAVFASLLTFAGISGLTGWSGRWRFSGRMAWVAGAMSGIFGGMVGNQGGIRSAAMLGFDLPPRAFIATATAAALMVDVGRLPVYLVSEWMVLRESMRWIALALFGVIAGTLIGLVVLRHIPEARFLKIVSGIVLTLGIYMFTQV